MNTFSGRQTVLKLGQLLNQSAQKETHREPRRRAKLAKLGRNPKNKTREHWVFSRVCGFVRKCAD
jgi:hypothetical protein